MLANEVAKVAGITVRTLHYYDEIGLLSVTKSNEAGYRNYTDQDIAKLQQILFFRALDFPLKQIKQIMEQPDYDRLKALEWQEELLNKEKKRIDEMLLTIHQTIEQEKAGVKMSNKERFEGFAFDSNPHEEEARERWGDQAVDEANKNVMRMTQDTQEEMNAIYRELASIRHKDPKSTTSQRTIEKWYRFLNEQVTTYSIEAFQGLGMLYIQDERFQKNIDQFGEGLAQFMSEAMIEFGQNKK
ncbi:MerR family transcriptional regulator [Halalkalibacillus halophilus]|uniref:MerR family transcriptional regulator n=1 Tax=Halalkalibacillus halophilus TaxID=392827 RepID=UPI0003F67E32|nr:MerR family transcriptional regulator [Halalkalibacillus halophilus]